MSTEIGALDILGILSHDKRSLGVILALVEAGPTGVAKIIAQLSTAGGSLGEAVVTHYNEAKAELVTVP